MLGGPGRAAHFRRGGLSQGPGAPSPSAEELRSPWVSCLPRLPTPPLSSSSSQALAIPQGCLTSRVAQPRVLTVSSPALASLHLLSWPFLGQTSHSAASGADGPSTEVPSEESRLPRSWRNPTLTPGACLSAQEAFISPKTRPRAVGVQGSCPPRRALTPS